MRLRAVLLLFCRAAVLLAALLLAAPSSTGLAADVRSEAVPEQEAALKQVETTAAADIKKAIQSAQGLLDKYGYAAVFGVIFLEGIGIPAPGETLVIAASIDASHPSSQQRSSGQESSGQGSSNDTSSDPGSLNIVVLMAITIAAAVLGNSAGYAIGRFGGHRLLMRLPLSQERLARFSTLFDRYGGWFILVARFIDGPRQLNGIIAGTLKMPWWEFSFWNAAGAVLWVSVWSGTAYWFGHDVDTIFKVLKPLEPILLGVLVILLMGAVAYLLWRKRAAGAASSGP